MKRINRYAALRIPKKLDYYDSTLRRLYLKLKKERRRRCDNKRNIKTLKLSVRCYVNSRELIVCCPVCHSIIDQNIIGTRRYVRCNICDCIYDCESKAALKCYYKYFPEAYKKIRNRRINNQIARNRLKIKHQEEADEAYTKKLYPQITVWNENGIEEIITNITKEIRESNDCTTQEKDILTKLQILPKTYRLLKKLGVDFRRYNSESIEDLSVECNNKERGD